MDEPPVSAYHACPLAALPVRHGIRRRSFGGGRRVCRLAVIHANRTTFGEIQQLQAAVQQGPREWPRYKRNSSNVIKRSAPSSPNWVNALPKWLNCAISYYNGKRSWTTRMHS